MKKAESKATSEQNRRLSTSRPVGGTWLRWCFGLALVGAIPACGPKNVEPKAPNAPGGTEQPAASGPSGLEAAPRAPAESTATPSSQDTPGIGSPGAAGEAGGPTAPIGADEGDAFGRAVKNINDGPKSYSSALSQLDAAINANPRFAEAHYNRGVVLQRLGDAAEAEKAYRKAIELKPTLAEAWLNLADVYRQQRDYTKAMGVLEEGLRASPQSATLMNGRALVLRLMGRNDEAIDQVRRILKINANDVNAYNNLGRIYIGLRDYEMARLVFEKALQTVPAAKDDPFIHHNMGVAYLGMKDNAAAQREFDQALLLNPDLVEALIDRAYLHLEVQEYEKAAELLRRAIAGAPRNVVARLNLGVALRGLKEYDKAQLQYEEALKVDPRNTAALLNYGILLGDYKEKYQEAGEVYKRLKEATPSGPESERVDKLIKEAQVNHERWVKRQKRLQDQKLKDEQRQREAVQPPAEGAAPGGETGTAPAGGSGAAAPAGASTPAPAAQPPAGGETPPGGGQKAQ